MFDDSTLRKIAQWIIRIVSACILLYLGIRHISSIVQALGYLATLVKPILIGIILALMLNVPMSSIESRLLKNAKRGKRGIAILLALILVLGIFIGVAFLVIPELVSAFALILKIVTGGLDQLAQMESDGAFPQIPYIEYVADIDWLGLKNQLETWLKDSSGELMNHAVGAAESVVSAVVTGVLGLTFSIYILAAKEKLKNQVSRLIRVWLPRRLGNGILHVSSVCGQTFKLFIAGQATEAIILGTLCMVGMAILRLPYAPMIGALVGVTALIPIIGAFVGTVVGAIMILTVSPLKAVFFVLFILILQQVEGNVIYPRVVGSKINLPAIWVLAAVTVGGNIGGPIGMLLGVPAASAAHTLLKEATQKRELAAQNESA